MMWLNKNVATIIATLQLLDIYRFVKNTKIYYNFKLIYKYYVRNPRVELIFENRFAREGCPRAYKHMVKLIFNPFETLGS